MRKQVSVPPPYARRRITRFLWLPKTLPDHPSPSACTDVRRWLEWATWEEQLNSSGYWEQMHWLDLRSDFPHESSFTYWTGK